LQNGASHCHAAFAAFFKSHFQIYIGNKGDAMFSQGALTGITVLDLSRLLPGPYCSMILADHGARVIAIEDKKQYAADGLFLPTVQRNKEHISLNLKSSQGLEIFLRLAKGADVIIEGFRPGVAQRLGVDYEAVRRVKSDIIYCAISGFGQTGPLRERVGHDINYLAHAGVLDLMGEPDRRPVIPGIQIADMAGGGLNGAIGILLALFARQRGGQGQYIDISMTDAAAAFLPVAQYAQELENLPPRRGDNLLSHRYACYNTYETADGRFMAVGALEGRFWRRLCAHLGLPAYGDLQFDATRRKEMIEAFERIFKTKPMAAWEAELGQMDIGVSAILTMEEALASPAFKARNMATTIMRADGGRETALGVPVKLSATPGGVRTPRAGFGQHTQEILIALGYTPEDIQRFKAQDVI
jgi:crotonobetainyl-CoA:carnitine CoA-transferase CaiB-like acyl-CoA transferase